MQGEPAAQSLEARRFLGQLCREITGLFGNQRQMRGCSIYTLDPDNPRYLSIWANYGVGAEEAVDRDRFELTDKLLRTDGAGGPGAVTKTWIDTTIEARVSVPEDDPWYRRTRFNEQTGGYEPPPYEESLHVKILDSGASGRDPQVVAIVCIDSRKRRWFHRDSDKEVVVGVLRQHILDMMNCEPQRFSWPRVEPLTN
jgi:hypothetical protein